MSAVFEPFVTGTSPGLWSTLPAMRILALDTSTWHLDAALIEVSGDGSFDVLAEAGCDTGKGMHSRLLPGLLRELLEEGGARISDLDAMAVGLGPGSFTGLRTGMATVRAMAYAARIPLEGASSLASMALSAATELEESRPGVSDALLVPVLDARRSQVYAGFYRLVSADGADDEPNGRLEAWHSGSGARLLAEMEDAVLAPADLRARLEGLAGEVVLFGSGIGAHPALAEDPRADAGAAPYPSASSLARLCASNVGPYDADRVLGLMPTYVRQKVVD